MTSDAAVSAGLRIVLIEPSHPGNIGAVARAMKTMGLERLFLVNPKCLPSAEATARAAGADDILHAATRCRSLGAALAGCTWVAGASARARHIGWPEIDARQCAAQVRARVAHAEVALVFGRESSGLANADLDQCHAVVRIPANPAFGSLNLAAAVQILGYEVALALPAGDAPGGGQAPVCTPAHVPVTTEQMDGLYTHLAQALSEIGYYDERAPRLLMRRLRKMFNRLEPDNAELNILRGILSAAQQAARRAR